MYHVFQQSAKLLKLAIEFLRAAEVVLVIGTTHWTKPAIKLTVSFHP